MAPYIGKWDLATLTRWEGGGVAPTLDLTTSLQGDLF